MRTYYYHDDTPTLHPVLGLIRPGRNEVPDELIEAAEACVEAGVLSHRAHALESSSRPPRASRPPGDVPAESPPETPMEPPAEGASV